MKKWKFDIGRFVQGAILFGFSAYLIKLLETGGMSQLVSPYIQMLLKVTLCLLIVMTFYALATIFTVETVFVEDLDEEGLIDGHGDENAQEHKNAHFRNQQMDPKHVRANDHQNKYQLKFKFYDKHLNQNTFQHTPVDAHQHDHQHNHQPNNQLDHNHDNHHSHHHDHHHAHADNHHGHDHDHRPKPRKSWILLMAPVIIGFFIPVQSLGASLLSSGLQSKAQIQQNYALIREKQQKSFLALQSKTPVAQTKDKDTIPSTPQNPSQNPDFVDISKLPKMTVPGVTPPPKPEPNTEVSLADLFNNLLSTPESYFNQSFKLTGFVYHPPGWPTNRLIVMRYMITCCLADANPIGVTVQTKDAAKYANDTWLDISGTLSAKPIPGGDTIPPIGWYYGSDEKPVFTAHEIKVVPALKQPYLYLPGTSSNLGGHN